MSGYVFVSNSNKPTMEEAKSVKDVVLTNVEIPCIKAAIDKNYKVIVGINRSFPDRIKSQFNVNFYNQHCYRSIYNIKDNIIALGNLIKVVKNNCIEVIHCNTPIGGMVGRLVGRIFNIKKVIYTVHGFHFYKGAPFFYNTIIKLIERIMARWTDVIITINEEDYCAAKKFTMKVGGKVFKVHGVGIDTDDFKYSSEKRNMIRHQLGVKPDDIVILSAGDLNENKNNIVILEALKQLNTKNIHYCICGVGPLHDFLEKKATEFGLLCQIHLLGYRSDIKDLLSASDIFALTSKREGLSRSLMEAMAIGLPCIVSNIRGNIDLIKDGEGGFLINNNRISSCALAIEKLYNNKDLRMKMSAYNKEFIKSFDSSIVSNEIKNIYQDVL